MNDLSRPKNAAICASESQTRFALEPNLQPDATALLLVHGDLAIARPSPCCGLVGHRSPPGGARRPRGPRPPPSFGPKCLPALGQPGSDHARTANDTQSFFISLLPAAVGVRADGEQRAPRASRGRNPDGGTRRPPWPRERGSARPRRRRRAWQGVQRASPPRNQITPPEALWRVERGADGNMVSDRLHFREYPRRPQVARAHGRSTVPAARRPRASGCLLKVGRRP
jgi:hypothetical protein